MKLIRPFPLFLDVAHVNWAARKAAGEPSQTPCTKLAGNFLQVNNALRPVFHPKALDPADGKAIPLLSVVIPDA
jgi:hypothetical protein